ncbi:Hypothetical protein NTJ_12607 [Nesidiocoris tenuis]|uniref:Uncharacterized protein n=1 Tax=Nesidiocoris tenuis TaxID=355587 RepID=A0ABN7B5V0_9HEMI|nr:Hypothetical protein NTJ_12607 [Nesidiocoris tenuis]
MGGARATRTTLRRPTLLRTALSRLTLLRLPGREVVFPYKTRGRVILSLGFRHVIILSRQVASVNRATVERVIRCPKVSTRRVSMR